MKRVQIISLFLALLCKVNAQPNYDVEINGLCYSLNLSESTAELVHVSESVCDMVVPQVILVSNRSFEVTSIDLRFGTYDYRFIRTISLPNSIINLRLGGSGWQANSNYYPRIAIISIPNSVEVVSSISCIKNLSSITIPPTVQMVNNISLLPDLRELIIEDGEEVLRWGNSDHSMLTGINSNIDYIYYGRQLIKAGINVNGFANASIFSDSIAIGPYVRDLMGYCLITNTLVIPNTVQKGLSGRGEIVFEDGVGCWECVNDPPYYGYVCGLDGWTEVHRWYIGRPGVKVANFDVDRLVLGPLLTSQQASDFFNNVRIIDYQDHYSCSVKGDGAFIKLYQMYPPQINSMYYDNAGRFFDNETYMNTPLYVPRGSKQFYEQADVWRNFFNIIEFDWEAPECSIEIINNNPELGTVEGAGIYHLGDTVTLSAIPSSGYTINGWFEFGEKVCSSRNYSFVVDRDRTLAVDFREAPAYVNVLVYSNNNAFGTVEGGGNYSFGEMVTLRAVPNAGYVLQYWYDDWYGLEVCSEMEYTFIADEARILIAVFGWTGIEENEEISDFFVFAKGRTILIEKKNVNSEIKVYNISGQCVYKGFETTITVPSSGVYIVAVECKRQKIIVE